MNMMTGIKGIKLFYKDQLFREPIKFEELNKYRVTVLYLLECHRVLLIIQF